MTDQTLALVAAALAFGPCVVCLLAYLAGAGNLTPTTEERAARDRWGQRAGLCLLGGMVAAPVILFLIWLI
jgi:hypothetical protein